MAEIKWLFELRSYYQAGYPPFWALYTYVAKYMDDILINQDRKKVMDIGPGWSLESISHDVIEYSADYFHKELTLALVNPETGERSSHLIVVYVPPFNGEGPPPGGALWDREMFTVLLVPPIPPPPPPPPLPPKPVEPPPKPPEPPPSEPPDAEPPPPCGDLDRETYREFRQNWGHQIDKVWFEVPLDDGVDVPDLDEPWRSVWKKLTQHRIDVVFERKGTLYVAEIKPRLSLAAIGTAIVARTMFRQKYQDWGYKVVRPAVICQYASPTLVQAAATHRVVIFVTKGIDGIYEPKALHDVIF